MKLIIFEILNEKITVKGRIYDFNHIYLNENENLLFKNKNIWIDVLLKMLHDGKIKTLKENVLAYEILLTLKCEKENKSIELLRILLKRITNMI